MVTLLFVDIKNRLLYMEVVVVEKVTIHRGSIGVSASVL